MFLVDSVCALLVRVLRSRSTRHSGDVPMARGTWSRAGDVTRDARDPGRELEERLIEAERLEEKLAEYENELLQMAALINP
eukprot:1324387-Rhodomonas_salina.2